MRLGQSRGKHVLAALGALVAAGTLAAPAAAGADTGLVGQWSFDELGGQSALDVGPYGLDGRLGATAEPDPADPRASAALWAARCGSRATCSSACPMHRSSPWRRSRSRRLCAPGRVPAASATSSRAAATAASRAPTACTPEPRAGWRSTCSTARATSSRRSPALLTCGTAQWHHVAGTFDGRVLRLFVDGRAVGEPLELAAADRLLDAPRRAPPSAATWAPATCRSAAISTWRGSGRCRSARRRSQTRRRAPWQPGQAAAALRRHAAAARRPRRPSCLRARRPARRRRPRRERRPERARCSSRARASRVRRRTAVRVRVTLRGKPDASGPRGRPSGAGGRGRSRRPAPAAAGARPPGDPGRPTRTRYASARGAATELPAGLHPASGARDEVRRPVRTARPRPAGRAAGRTRCRRCTSPGRSTPRSAGGSRSRGPVSPTKPISWPVLTLSPLSTSAASRRCM